VQFVADMKASRPFAIELNFSCPHTRDGGGTVYQHPALAKRITKQVRELLDSIEAPPRVLIKVGHLKREDVKRLCDATLPYIDGYTAINTKATRVLQRAELGFGVRYFDGDSGFEKAGISGVAIQKCALETIAAFADEYSRTGTKDHVIFGVGGVTSPPDVQTFLDAGADIVQATTAFMHNHRFAADVRFFLAGRQLDHERAAVKTLVAAMPESVCPKNDADEFRRYLENRLPELHKEFVQTRL